MPTPRLVPVAGGVPGRRAGDGEQGEAQVVEGDQHADERGLVEQRPAQLGDRVPVAPAARTRRPPSRSAHRASSVPAARMVQSSGASSVSRRGTVAVPTPRRVVVDIVARSPRSRIPRRGGKSV